MKDRPIMANIVDIDDGHGGTIKDFSGHTMYYDDETEKTIYVEVPVGHVINPDNIRVEYDDEYERNFAMADCVIYEEYTDTCDILRRRKKVDCSVELCVRELSFDSSTKELRLDDYYVQGITLLGEGVLPGMKGSNVTLKDFSVENNSIINKAQLKEEIITEIMSQLNNDKKADFSAENSKEGGKPKDMDKFNELLAKYNKTAEEITFEYENMTDEELVAAFAEAFDEDDPSSKEGVTDEGTGTPEVVDDFADDDPAEGDDQTGDDNPTDDDPTDDDPTDDEEDPDEEDHQSTSAIEDEDSTGTTKKFQKVFEVSHEDVRAALYALLAPYEENDNEWYWISAVYDNHFVYEGWDENHIFDQKYTKDGDIISFEGERTTLHRELLTDSEYAALNEMRSNYSAIETELNSYKSKELHSQREAVLASEDYSVMADFTEFKELKEHMDDYSVEELTNKADLIYAKFMKSTFAAKSPAKKTGLVFMTSGKNEEEERLPYGGLFKNFKGRK